MGAHFPPKKLLFSFFSALVSFNAARKPFTSISFVVMLLTEASVKESDGIRKDQIYPLAQQPMMLLGVGLGASCFTTIRCMQSTWRTGVANVRLSDFYKQLQTIRNY